MAVPLQEEPWSCSLDVVELALPDPFELHPQYTWCITHVGLIQLQ